MYQLRLAPVGENPNADGENPNRFGLLFEQFGLHSRKLLHGCFL